MITVLEKSDISGEDLLTIIDAGTEESINLDFKSGESLDQTDKKKAEIAKDVSAFANSAGGYIVYGIKEENHKATSLSPVDGSVFTKEWLEQIIQTRIQRKIEGLIIKPIRISNDIKQSVYVVRIPESPLAPHMTSDKKFYKRYNFESVQMEEYEIRNLYNRKEKTELVIDNVVTSKRIEYEESKDGRLAFLNLSFQVRNIGRAVEKDYKLLIKLNFTNYQFRWDVLRSDKNVNHSVLTDNKRMISFFGVSPLFPEEVLTIGTVELGLLLSTMEETINVGELKMTLLFTNGQDEMTIRLSEIFKPAHNTQI